MRRAFFEPFWEEIVLGRAGLVERLEPVLARIAPEIPAAELIAYWFRQDNRLDRELIEEVAALRAAGGSVYLATNQEHLRARYLMEEMRLSEHFDGIHYSAALGRRKPQPEFFEAVAARLGRAFGDLVLIDDSAENVAAATEACCTGLLWTGEERLGEMLERMALP